MTHSGHRDTFQYPDSVAPMPSPGLARHERRDFIAVAGLGPTALFKIAAVMAHPYLALASSPMILRGCRDCNSGTAKQRLCRSVRREPEWSRARSSAGCKLNNDTVALPSALTQQTDKKGTNLGILLLTSNNGRYCGLAFISEIGDGILDASHFLDATFGTALLLLDVRAACFSSCGDIGQPCLARVGKVCDMLLEASGNAVAPRFGVAADFFDIRPAGTDTRFPTATRLRHRARREHE